MGKLTRTFAKTLDSANPPEMSGFTARLHDLIPRSLSSRGIGRRSAFPSNYEDGCITDTAAERREKKSSPED